MNAQIEVVDLANTSLLEELWDYYREVFAEAQPDDPPEPMARTIADWQQTSTDQEVRRWLLRIDGSIQGAAVGAIDLVDNLDSGFGRVHVTAARRGQGWARQLALPLLDWMGENGRVKLLTSVIQGGGSEGLPARLGFKEAYHDQTSRLRLAEVDGDLMQAWIDRASERAHQYRVVEIEHPLKGDELDRYCEILLQLNTAPREEVDEEDFTMTPERWLERDRNNREGGYLQRTMVAVHQPTGVFAASTSVAIDQLDPGQAWQWETVVDPEHRELGLGRWVKAAMVQTLTETEPELRQIDTENSAVNEAMLNINLAMGFRPLVTQVYWQGSLEQARTGFRL